MPSRRCSGVIECRSCGAQSTTLVGACAPIPKAKYISTGPGNLYRCDACGLLQRDIIPNQDELLALYRSEPVEYLNYTPAQNVAWSRASAYLEKRFAHRGSGVRVLDVGCHTGGFLSGLSSRFERFGIEADGAPAVVASTVNHVRLIGERIEAISPQVTQGFDVVTFFDVLEHLSNPTHGLDVAAKLLREGGVLIFSTADADAWTWQYLGAGHWYLQTAQHLGVLSKTYVRRLVGRRKWSIEMLDSIAHAKGSPITRLHQTIQLLHWSAQGRKGIWRVGRRLLQELPGCRDIRHRESVPWTMALTDHMLVAIRV